MPATAFAHVGMTWLLLLCRGAEPKKVQRKDFRVGLPNINWVGRAGHGQNAGQRSLKTFNGISEKCPFLDEIL